MLSPKCACVKCSRLDFSPTAMKVPQPLLESKHIIYYISGKFNGLALARLPGSNKGNDHPNYCT